MLTDIFAARYEARPIWTAINEPERMLLVRSWRIVAEQLMPYWKDSKVDPEQKSRWDSAESKLSMELGLESLSPKTYGFYDVNKVWQGGTYSTEMVCKSWMLEPYKDGHVTPDRYMKERISFVELAFRHRRAQVHSKNAAHAALHKARPTLRSPTGSTANELTTAISELQKAGQGYAAMFNQNMNAVFNDSCTELNERFRQAKVPLNYHNGFIQIESDALVQSQIAAPFWALIADPKWKNVEHDMVEAVDRREANDRDPAFYSMRALESTIKIVSDEKRWTRGTETSASHYLDNLQAKTNGKFIDSWEADAMRLLFKDVRNPLSHGPGSKEMPAMRSEQTDWVIECCMSWVRTLVRRM